jgi:hypothetical protein
MGGVAVVGQAGAPLAEDDRALVAATDARGGRAVSVGWDDLGVDWRSFDRVVLRSCWNYHRDRRGFRCWLRRLEASGTTVVNPLSLVCWNLNKAYLLELARDVTVVPTIRVEADERRDLPELAELAGWERVVAKPAVSASSFATCRFDNPHDEGAPSLASTSSRRRAARCSWNSS